APPASTAGGPRPAGTTTREPRRPVAGERRGPLHRRGAPGQHDRAGQGPDHPGTSPAAHERDLTDPIPGFRLCAPKGVVDGGADEQRRAAVATRRETT